MIQGQQITGQPGASLCLGISCCPASLGLVLLCAEYDGVIDKYGIGSHAIGCRWGSWGLYLVPSQAQTIDRDVDQGKQDRQLDYP